MATAGLTGRVTETIGDEFTTIRITSTRQPVPYFVVDHGLALPGPVLIGMPDQPIAFEVKSSGRRGFVTTLTYTGRTAAGEDVRPIAVASLNSFDPTRTDNEATLCLDRWSDGRQLLLGSMLAGARDGAFSTGADRSVVKLNVAPLLAVHAGGVEWNGSGPRDASRQEFDLLAGWMAKYQPGHVVRGLGDADLKKLRARLQELADTDSSAGWEPEGNQSRDFRTTAAARSAPAGAFAAAAAAPRSDAEWAALVRGVPLPATPAPIALQSMEAGAESTFQVALFACPPDSFAAFRQGISPSAA